MKHLFTKIFLFHLLLIGAVQVTAQNKKSGNPILPGFHADPEVLYSHQTKRYYIYPTSDGFPGWGGSYFKVFSSKNLKTWKEETVILEMGKNVSWANGNAWAPCIEEKKIDGKYKYFFYYSANPTTNKGKQIGVDYCRFQKLEVCLFTEIFKIVQVSPCTGGQIRCVLIIIDNLPDGGGISFFFQAVDTLEQEIIV